MKKIILILTIFLIILTGCKKETNENYLKFKEDYELLNKKDNYRQISLDNEVNIKTITGEEVVEKIENKETFYIYFGSPSCPWCRSIIEMALEIANKKDITIYYVDIWEDDHEEILRDRYKINDNGEIETIYKGTDSYKELLKYFDSFLNEYTLTDKDGNIINLGEKRIFAPSFFYIEDGKTKKHTTGISTYQKNANEELTDEILEDEKEKFNEFFKD